MRKTGFFAAAAITAALAVAAPGTASAAPQALATCPNGYVVAKQGVNVYSGWNSFRVIGTLSAGDVARCYSGYDLGRRYTACGVSDGNGWVRLVANDGTRGWAPQACFVDL